MAADAESRTLDVNAFFENAGVTRFHLWLLVISSLVTLFDGLDFALISYVLPYLRDDSALRKKFFARLHAMFGHLELAIPLYERALELQPGDALRHSVLGGCYLADGRIDDARAQFERAVEIDPDGDPGKYAAQELAKMKPSTSGPDDDETKKKKRWGLW